MATVNYTNTDIAGNYAYVWSNLANGDDGQPARYSGSGDRTVQVLGIFGSGGSVTIEGTLDGTNWATLHDTGGSDLTFTSAGIEAVLENCLSVRANVTAGDGTTDLTVIMNVRREA